jgi:hypothetical protein
MTAALPSADIFTLVDSFDIALQSAHRSNEIRKIYPVQYSPVSPMVRRRRPPGQD